MKKLLLFPCLLLALGLSSCESSDDEVMSIELVSPKKLAVTTELATASFKWDAVAKAEGYAYALDNSTEYTTVDAATTTLKLTRLSRGSHTFRIYAVGNQGHTTDSAERTVDFDIDPTLPTPAPSFRKGDGVDVAIISWKAVKDAAGYAYKFNDAPQWTEVGPDVLEITQDGLKTDETNTYRMYAIGKQPDSENSPEATLNITMIDTSKGAWILMASGEPIKLTSSAADIYTHTFDKQSSDSFEIIINGETYGFATHSGNGGIGTINNANAAVAAGQYVRESRGQMAKKTDDTEVNKFWINPAAECKVEATFDFTNADGIPRYYMTLAEKADASIILAEYFDLMVSGGDFSTGKAGFRFKASTTNATDIDGTEPVDAAAKVTDFGVAISDGSAAPKYTASRGLADWNLNYCYEFVGCIRLSNTVTSATSPQAYGILTTPALSALTGATNVTLTFDAVQFGQDSDNISIKVLNAGKITSAEVKIKGAAPATAITPENDNTILIKKAHYPGQTNAAAKEWSNFTVVIEGATAATQISWDTTSVGAESKFGRLCLDNIVVKKN